MRLRLLLLPALCLLASCAKTLDDRVTRAQWYSPASVPTYQKLAPEQRIAFTIYRNHIVRLNFGRADGLPDDVTWMRSRWKNRSPSIVEIGQPCGGAHEYAL